MKFEVKITKKLTTLLQCVSKEEAIQVLDILALFPAIRSEYEPYNKIENRLIYQILAELESQLIEYNWWNKEK